MTRKEQKLKKSNIGLIVALAVVIAAFLAFILYQHFGNRGEVTVSNSYDIAQGQEAEEDATNTSTDPGIKIPGYTQVSIPAGQTDVDFTMTNPEENQVYFQISLILTDTQDEIFRSDLIQPGDSLYHITLNHALEAGTYDLTVQYDTFTTDGSFTPMNGATMNCVLTVQ